MSKKYRLLLWGILFDLIGMLSFVVPFVGEFSDAIWAPLSAYLMIKMYKGIDGKVAAGISFIEEAGILGTDLIPTFTLTWIYRFLIKKEKREERK